MILDDARAAVLLSGGAAGVVKRLAMCADLLEQRKRQKKPLDSDKEQAQANTLVQRRVAAIRAQLLPSWGEGRTSATADELLIPSQAAPRIEAMLEEVQNATPGKKVATALVAGDLVRMVRMVEQSELNLGLTNVINGAQWRTVMDRIQALTPAEEPEAPSFMQGHTHARAMVHEWIEAWRPPEKLAQSIATMGDPSLINVSNVAPALYEKLLAIKERTEIESRVITSASNAIYAANSDEERAKARAHYNQLVEAYETVRNEFYDLRAKLNAMVREAQDAMQGPVADAAQECITEVMTASPVTPEQAQAWASDQVISPAAKARLRKNGYQPEQVIKDMAEFYRFTRGRVEKLRIDTNGGKRANTVGIGAHGQPGVIYIDSDFDKRVLWHEMGHHIEADPAAGAAARMFIRMRADDPKPYTLRSLTGIKGYRADEVAYKDHFFSPYIGKIYSHGTTEVFSMGLETFSNPALLATRMKQDPQTLQFVMGYIHSPQDTLQALHLAMRQSLRQATDDAQEAVQEVGQAKYKALAVQAKFTPDESLDWAVAKGVDYSASSGGTAKQMGYITENGEQVHIAKASVRNPQTNRKAQGYRVMMVYGLQNGRHGLRYMDYVTKDFDAVLAAAMLLARTKDTAWLHNILEGKF